MVILKSSLRTLHRNFPISKLNKICLKIGFFCKLSHKKLRTTIFNMVLNVDMLSTVVTLAAR